jgi:hypothetical protein
VRWFVLGAGQDREQSCPQLPGFPSHVSTSVPDPSARPIVEFAQATCHVIDGRVGSVDANT